MTTPRDSATLLGDDDRVRDPDYPEKNRKPFIRQFAQSLADFNWRTWSLLIALFVWLGFVACHLIGAHIPTEIFTGLAIFTWGFGIATLTPIEDAIEYFVFSTATSAALAIVLGTVLVEAHLTAAFLAIYLVLGVGSLVAQTISLASEFNRVSPIETINSDGEVMSAPDLTASHAKMDLGPTDTTQSVSNPPRVDATSCALGKRRSHVPYLSVYLSMVGLAVVFGAALSDRHLNPGLWGLPGSITPYWYVGIALIIAGVAAARHGNGVEIGVAAICLVVGLTATAPIVYDAPRLSWTEKHVGVVDYILHYGQVHAHIDIYQSWPGFFSAIAWIATAGDIHDPLVIARVWPPVIDVLSLIAVRCFAGRLLANHYRAWIAALAFLVVSVSFNLDYFSPQAISLFLALALYAIAIPRVDSRGSVELPFRLPPWRLCSVVFLSIAIAITHQLTPYFVALSLACLVVFRVLRPIWLPLVPLLPAAGWALINYSAWKRYFAVDQIGNVSGNVATPGTQIAGQHHDIVLNTATAAIAAGPVLLGLFAVAVLWRHRDRLHLAIAGCAASAAVIPVVSSYGGEGLYRATLFALPWVSVLAFGWGSDSFGLHARTQPIRIVAAPILTFLFIACLLATFALDGYLVVRPNEIKAELDFERSAPRGSALIALGVESPANMTYRYPDLHILGYEANSGINVDDYVSGITEVAKSYPTSYVFTSEAAEYYGEIYGVYSPGYYKRVVAKLRGSPLFRTVLYTKGAQLFELKSSRTHSNS